MTLFCFRQVTLNLGLILNEIKQKEAFALFGNQILEKFFKLDAEHFTPLLQIQIKAERSYIGGGWLRPRVCTEWTGSTAVQHGGVDRRHQWSLASPRVSCPLPLSSPYTGRFVSHNSQYYFEQRSEGIVEFMLVI